MKREFGCQCLDDQINQLLAMKAKQHASSKFCDAEGSYIPVRQEREQDVMRAEGDEKAVRGERSSVKMGTNGSEEGKEGQ